MQTRSSPAINSLHSLARQVEIPNYYNMSKSQLYNKLKEQFNFERLQRANSRNSVLGKRSNTGDNIHDDMLSKRMDRKKAAKKMKRNKSDINTVDPIMLGPLTKNVFKLVRANGTCVMFNVESLIDYFLATGDFTDPETRLPFSDTDLKTIDHLAMKAGLKKASVYTAKKNPQNFTELKFHRDALQGLERLAGEVVADMFLILESYDPDEAEMRLVMREFPMFADLFRQMKEADPAYASDAMRHYKSFLKGPPNRPTEDMYGFLEVILHFLSRCESGEDPQNFGF